MNQISPEPHPVRFVSYAHNGEDVLLNRLFAGVAQGFYVDVGAHDPVQGSVTKAFSDRGWRGINLHLGPAFERLVAARPRDINLQITGLDRTDIARFPHGAGVAGLSPVATSPALATAGASYGPASYDVPDETLTAILAAHAPGQAIDFLKIGVTGAEGSMIMGADWCAIRPTVLVAAATAAEPCDLANPVWEPALLAEGYRRVWFDGCNYFYVPAQRDDLLRHFVLPINARDQWVPFDPDRTELETACNALNDELATAHTRLAATAAELATAAVALSAERDRSAALMADAAALRRLAQALAWPGGPRALRAVLPLARVLRTLAHGPRGRTVSAEPRILGGVKLAAKRVLRVLAGLLRPVVYPIAWRTRAFMTREVHAELARLERKLDTLGAGGPAGEVARMMETTLLTLALDRRRDRN